MRPGRVLLILAVTGGLASALGGCGLRLTTSVSGSAPLRIGAIYPLKTGGQPARDEYHGLLTALTLANRSGGVHGRHVALTLQDVPSGADAPRAVRRLKGDHVAAIVGSESSLVGLPASEAANAAHLFYLESGAVATMLTARGRPDVFRSVTTAQSLGREAARFAGTVIAPRLGIPRRRLRVAVIHIHDVYGDSVGRAQVDESRRLGFHLVRVISYDYPGVNFSTVVEGLRRVHPDVVLVAAYRPDAIQFRRATLRLHLHVGAMIGTSSSFCMMGFARALGTGAVGLFAADKPDIQINPAALDPAARGLSHRAGSLYQRRYGVPMSAPAVAGFVGGWILFHEILPTAGSLTTDGLRRAALRLNLPFGSEINGAGVYFAGPSAGDAGQNLRAVSVVWQWQHPMKAVIVSPKSFATGRARFIPLPNRP